jgi:hypothetical protein
MPLQIPAGIRLTPKKATWEGPLFEHLDVALPAEAPPVSVLLPVKRMDQEGKCWCWAACMSMVLDFYKRPKSQCDIVQEIYKTGPDLCAKSFAEKDQDCQPENMENAWTAKTIPIESVVALLSGRDNPSTVSFSQVQTEIQTGRPIQVGIRYTTKGSHALIISGYSTLPERVWLNDPAVGVGFLTYHDLETYNSNGKWVHTWTKIIPKQV